MSREWLDDETLRETLRRGDPAADGHDPAPEEIEAWRRAMLREAARASMPRRFTIPLGVKGLAAAAAVTLAAALLWTVWGTGFRRVEAPPARITEIHVEAPAPQVALPAPSVAQGEVETPTHETAPPARALPAEPLPAVPGQPASGQAVTLAGVAPAATGQATAVAEAAPPVPPAEDMTTGDAPASDSSGATPGRSVESPVAVPVVARRTLQFTTPGGTRVFWTLERAPAAGI